MTDFCERKEQDGLKVITAIRARFPHASYPDKRICNLQRQKIKKAAATLIAPATHAPENVEKTTAPPQRAATRPSR
jgi:hypothetical protein